MLVAEEAVEIRVLRRRTQHRRLGVPGVGHAFIDGGKVVYAGGLGSDNWARTKPWTKIPS
jgi:hypothetical protein